MNNTEDSNTAIIRQRTTTRINKSKSITDNNNDPNQIIPENVIESNIKLSSKITNSASIEDDAKKSINNSHYEIYKKNSHWSLTNIAIIISFTIISLALRLYKITDPSQVVFDEVHFGGFASNYLKGTYFFDVHPPLGKLIIAGIGHFYGYRGSFGFKDIGDSYAEDPSVPFAQLRGAMSLFGSGAVSFALGILIEMGFSPVASVIAGTLLSFDNGLITQSKFILLDSMLLFFIFGSVFFWIKFRQSRSRSFSLTWWSHLIITGIFLAGTVGIKLVGLFTVALVGAACLYDLWELSDWKRQMSDRVLWSHFYARFVSLACVPVALYLSFYYVHFAMLPLSGPGDAHMSTEFQQSLLGNKMHVDARPVYYGQSVRIQNKGERVYLHSHVERIPLTHLDGKISSQGQQVNGYSTEDQNNVWEFILVKSVTGDLSEITDVKLDEDDTEKLTQDDVVEDISAHSDAHKRIRMKLGDVVKICHKATGKCLLTHDVASALTRTNMEITMWEPEGTESETLSHWIIEGADSDGIAGKEIKSLGTTFYLVNQELKVKLLNFGKNLPPWGFGQRELNGCRNEKNNTPHHKWMISHVLEPMTAEEEEQKLAAQSKMVPMGFFKKFWELQVYSLVANSGLVDEHPFKSRPEEWPLPLRGLGFWNEGTKRRIFMMGNLVSWSIGTLSVIFFILRFPKDQFLKHRGRISDQTSQKLTNKILFLLSAYLIHYLPFYLMKRSLYLHHYLPAFMFSVLITAAQLDSLFFKHSGTSKSKLLITTIIALSTLFAFVYLLPLVYGTEIESDLLNKRKFIKSWNF